MWSPCSITTRLTPNDTNSHHDRIALLKRSDLVSRALRAKEGLVRAVLRAEQEVGRTATHAPTAEAEPYVALLCLALYTWMWASGKRWMAACGSTCLGQALKNATPS